jgi:ribosomal protein S18 acetylase RimI-like enzyme
LRSWLHVGAANTHAIDFYTFLGFRPVRTLTLHRIERSG